MKLKWVNVITATQSVIRIFSHIQCTIMISLALHCVFIQLKRHTTPVLEYTLQRWALDIEPNSINPVSLRYLKKQLAWDAYNITSCSIHSSLDTVSNTDLSYTCYASYFSVLPAWYETFWSWVQCASHSTMTMIRYMQQRRVRRSQSVQWFKKYKSCQHPKEFPGSPPPKY